MIVKICGIMQVNDAAAALQAGADWIGLNLVAGPRRITLAAAAHIASQVPDTACLTALVACPDGKVDAVALAELRAARIRRLQLYGDVLPETVQRLAEEGLETILAHGVAGPASLRELDEFLCQCRGVPPNYILLDACVPGRLGGTGRTVDWKLVATFRHRGHDGPADEPPKQSAAPRPPCLLAGGLTVRNLATAIELARPDGVDVSSGVESRPGRKSASKIAAFVAAVRATTSGA